MLQRTHRMWTVSLVILAIAVMPAGARQVLAALPAPRVAGNSGAIHPSTWPMQGHDAASTNFNPAEHSIGANSMSRLHPVWRFSGVDIGWGMYTIAGPGAVYVLVRQNSRGGPAIVALDPGTGHRLRVFGAKDLALSGTTIRGMRDQPVALAYSDGVLIVANLLETVGLNPVTGHRNWVVPGGSFFLTVANGVVYTPTQAIAITSGHVIWKRPGGGGPPLLTAGYLYQEEAANPLSGRAGIYRPAGGSRLKSLPAGVVPMTGDGMTTYDLAYVRTKGAVGYRLEAQRRAARGPVQWRHSLANRCISAWMTLAYSTLYITCQATSGHGTLEAVTTGSGRVLWSSTLSTVVPFSLVANGLLFMGANSGLVALNAGTGRVVRRITVGGPDVRPIMIAGGTLYVLNDSTLIALHA